MSDTTISKGKNETWRSLVTNGNSKRDVDARLHGGLSNSMTNDAFQLIPPPLSNGRSNGISYETYDSRSLDDDEMSVDDEVSEIAPFDLTSDLTDSDRFLLHSGVEEDGFDFNQIDQETRSKLELLLPGIFCEESLDPSFMQNLQSSLAKYIEEADLKELVHNLPIDKVDSNLLMKLHEDTIEHNDYEFTNTFIKACGAGHIEIIKSLVNDYCKIDLDAKGTNGETTALMEACIGGYYDVVEYILQRNASPKIKSSSGNTALHYAALGGHADICELLLNYGANIEETNENGHTALMEAASAGHVNVAEVLLDHGAGINAHSNEFKESALTLASYKGHYEMVKFLLQRGADKQHKTDEMHTALMEACMDGHVEVARLLLDHGAEVNMPPDSFESPLTLAACGGHIELAQLLIERGANLEEMNDEGYTPLMEAAREGHDAMASLLIDSGANVNTITEETQETALTLACCGGSLDVVRLLLNDCADPNLGGSTPLMEAAQEGHIEIVLFLLQNGAIADAVTNSGDTALSYACENGHTEVLEVLIDAGCDVNRADPESGRTPLMRAARAGHLKTVEKLIACGARVNEATLNNDQTALSLACAGGHVQVAQCLIQNGADVGYILHDNSNCLIETARGGHAIVAQLLLHSAKEIAEDPSVHENRLSCDNSGSDFFVTTSLPESDFGETTNKHDKFSNYDEYVQYNKNECCMGDLSSSLVEQLGRIAPERMLDALKRPIPQECITSDERLMENLEYVLDKANTMLNSDGLSYESNEKIDHCLPGITDGDDLENENQEEQLLQKKMLLEKLQKAEKELHEKTRIHLRLDAKNDRKPLCMASQLRPAHLPEQWGVYLPQCGAIETVEPSNEIASLLESDITHLNAYNSCLPLGNNIGGKITQSDCDSSEANSSNVDIVQHLVDGIKSFTEQNEKQTHLNTDTKKALEHLRELAQNPVTAVDQIKLLSAAAAAAASVIPGENQRDESFLRELHKIASNTAAMEAQMKLTKGGKVDCMMCQNSNTLPSPNTNAIGCQVVFSPPTIVNEQVDTSCVAKSKMDSFVPRSLKLDLLKNFENAQTMLKDLEEKHQASLQSKRALSKEGQAVSQSNCIMEQIPDNTNPAVVHTNSTMGTRKKKYLSSTVLNVNAATESNHDTALTLACSGGHEELVLMLLREGADIEHKDKKGYTPLILSATAGHVNIVQLLIDHGADIEAQSEKTKDTALSLACSSGKCDTVELLLSKGANKEHRNVSDYTPLSLAASGGFINIINLLLSYGAEINSRTNSKLGISPLMLAAMNGHMNAVKLLLDMGADINAQIETNRNTALTLACYQGRAEVVSLLVDRKANIEHRAKTGLTPLMEAASGGYVEVGKVLIEKGADVNAAPVPSSRDTALTIAADKGHSKFIELLLDNMASIDMRNKKSATPLWLASHGGHLEAVQTLVLRGAHPDSEDSRKVSCLMAAFKKGHVKVVKYLVKHVRQFPSDSDCIKYIAQITDKEMLKKCNQCMDIIMAAKDHQTQEADKAANSLLEELDLEKFREESKRQAAAKKREKRKLKRQIKKNQKPANVNNEDTDGNSDREVMEPVTSANPPSSNRENESTASLKMKHSQPDLPNSTVVAAKICDSKTSKIENDADALKVNQQKFSNNSKSKKKRKSVKERTRLFEDKNKKVNKEKSSVTVDENKDDKSSKSGGHASSPDRDVTRVPISSDITSTTQNYSNGSKLPVDNAKNLGTSPRENLKSTAGRRKSTKKNFEEGWTEVVGKQKRIQVSQEHLQRVTGRAGCNLSSIREVTGAQVELESKKATNGDQIIIIKGSADSIKHAYQLIQALINNSDSDLVNLLPSNLKSKVSLSSSSFPDSTTTTSSNLAQEPYKVTSVAYSRSSSYTNHHTVPPRFQQMKQSFPSIADIDVFPALGPGRTNTNSKTSGHSKVYRPSNPSTDVNKKSNDVSKTSPALITTTSCSSSNVWVNSNRSKAYMNSHSKGRVPGDTCDVFSYPDASFPETNKNIPDGSGIYTPFGASVPFLTQGPNANNSVDEENKQQRMFSDVVRALNLQSSKTDDSRTDNDDSCEADIAKAPGYRRTQSNAGSLGMLKFPEVSRALSASSNPDFLKSSLYKISKSENSAKTPVESLLETANNKTEFVNSHFYMNDALPESTSYNYQQPLVSSNGSANIGFSQMTSSLNPNAPDFQTKHSIYSNINQHYSCPVNSDIAANLLRLTQLNLNQRQPALPHALLSNQNLSSFNHGNSFVHPLVQPMGRQLPEVQNHNSDCISGSHTMNNSHFNSITNNTMIPNSCIHRPVSQQFSANWSSAFPSNSDAHRSQLQQRYLANRMVSVCQNPQGVIWRPDNLVMNQDGFLPSSYYGLNGMSASRVSLHVSPMNDALTQNKIFTEPSILVGQEKTPFSIKFSESDKMNAHEKELMSLRGQVIENSGETSKNFKTVGVIGGERKRMTDVNWNRPDLQRRTNIPYPNQVSSMYRPLLPRYENQEYSQSMLNQNWMPPIM